MTTSAEARLGNLLSDNGLWLAVAESCTGGMLGHLITNVPGSSAYFKGGVIAYANEVKMGVLGVSPATLDSFGAVSKETVLEMAKGIKNSFDVDIGLSVSGIAGPEGGTEEKPVGTVWIGLCTRKVTQAEAFLFSGDRKSIKKQAAQSAMEIAIRYLSEKK
jgi:PncC family amidohydrolase